MKITAIEIQNIRCFSNIPKTNLSKSINIFIGANNAGKSTILKIIQSLQTEVLNKTDRTIGMEEFSHAKLFFNGSYATENHVDILTYDWIEVRPGDKNQLHLVQWDEEHQSKIFKEHSRAKTTIPNNLIYPYLSNRKPTEYSTIINEQNTFNVTGDFSNLYAKVDHLNNSQLEEHFYFQNACLDILGFHITTTAIQTGKQAGYTVKSRQSVPLTAMGEGVANVLGLVTDLCLSDNQIFLIEEPENDIHPRALKVLLKLIIDKSKTNQFFVSTHSNIVMKYLGGLEESKVFNVVNDVKISESPKLMLSKINEISANPIERRSLLEDLGYDYFDFDLWEAWLFLEESSAEVIINKLIHWFVPNLVGRLRTFSAGGAAKIPEKFDDFNQLFVFLHLQEVYKNKVWVKLDGGNNEGQILNKMKSLYVHNGWHDDNFAQFTEHDFEKYYPRRFNSEVSEVLAIKDKGSKRKAKKQLLDKVKDWIKANEQLAKEKFSQSAKEVVDYLRWIDTQL